MSLLAKLIEHLKKRKPEQSDPPLWKQYIYLTVVVVGTISVAGYLAYLMVYTGNPYPFAENFASDEAAWLMYTMFGLPAGFMVTGSILMGLEKVYSVIF